MTTAEPFVIDRESAPSYWQLDSLWTVLASASTTGNSFTCLDQLMPRRSGPPPHVHERYHEFFYLLDGEIRFQAGDRVLGARSGQLLSIPPGTAHSFAVVSETARVLNMYTPGGFEEQVVATGTPAGGLHLPPAGGVRPPTPEQEEALARRAVEVTSQSAAEGVADLLADERAPFRRPHR